MGLHSSLHSSRDGALTPGPGLPCVQVGRGKEELKEEDEAGVDNLSMTWRTNAEDGVAHVILGDGVRTGADVASRNGLLGPPVKQLLPQPVPVVLHLRALPHKPLSDFAMLQFWPPSLFIVSGCSCTAQGYDAMARRSSWGPWGCQLARLTAKEFFHCTMAEFN